MNAFLDTLKSLKKRLNRYLYAIFKKESTNFKNFIFLEKWHFYEAFMKRAEVAVRNV